MFDPWDPAVRANPHPFYHHLRAEAPVYACHGPVSGATFWFLTRYDDCVATLRDKRIGKEIEKHLPDSSEVADVPQSGFEVLNRNMLFVDPPDHTRLRRLVSTAFTPRIIAELEPRIVQIGSELIEAVTDRDEIDLIADFAFPLPVTVIAEMLGVPASDRDLFRGWTKRLIFSDDMFDAQLAGLEFVAYMNEQIDHRRSHPGDDLLTGLLDAEEEGDRLDHAETLAMILLLLVAGHETTVNLIGNGMLALLEHPDQMARLRAHPALMSGAIEEMLRYDGPVEVPTLRWAFEDIVVGRETISAGDLVVPVLLAANRDPEQFAHPDRFDIERTPNRHIAFGTGIHHCLGAPLARLEATVAFTELLASFDQIELAANEADLRWNMMLFLRGVKALPLVVKALPPAAKRSNGR